jgi:hypothetical protein
MRRPEIARAALLALTAYCLFLGLTATVVPHVFFDDFPFLAHWVERLPPYNEHLVTDVGGLYLAFALLFAWAARTLDRTLIRATCTAWLLAATLHLIFHAAHLGNFTTADAVGQIASLALLLVPPAVAIWATGPATPDAER